VPCPKDLQLATNMHMSLSQAVLSTDAVPTDDHSSEPAVVRLVVLVPFLAVGSCFDRQAVSNQITDDDC
jgi:hypothetical protein